MKVKEIPLVSVISLCYNHSRFLKQSLDSIKNQTYKNIELIIVDDNSTDNSAKLIECWLKENPEIKYEFIKHKHNKSICFSHNEMLKLAKGKYISLIATDDIYKLDKIQKQVNLFESLPDDYGVVYGDMHVINASNEIIHGSFYTWYLQGKSIPSGNVLDDYIDINPVHVLGSLVKRSVFDRVGPYDESLVFEDWDMGFRWARSCKFYYHDDIVSSYRKFNGQMTDAFWKNPQKYLDVLDTNFRMFIKHLDLKEPYRSKILKKLKSIHHEMLQNPFFTSTENLQITKKILKEQPTIYYITLYFFSIFGLSNFFLKLKNKVNRLIALFIYNEHL